MTTGSVKGATYTLKDLFERNFYKIDSYQREYAWSADDVRTLIDDLIEAFQESWQEGHRKSHYSDPDRFFSGHSSSWTSREIGDSWLMGSSGSLRFILYLFIFGVRQKF
jgi:hypothetical protein